MPNVISVTPYADSGIYLLNPARKTSDGEWDAAAQLFRGTPKRYASFRELMLDEQKQWLKNLRASLHVG